MQGNSLWEMQKHGNKLSFSESGFCFEIERIIFDGESEASCSWFDRNDEVCLKCGFSF
jgi:hypothetical protein